MTYQEALEAWGRNKAGLPEDVEVAVWVDINTYDGGFDPETRIEISVYVKEQNMAVWVGEYSGDHHGLAHFMSEVMSEVTG